MLMIIVCGANLKTKIYSFKNTKNNLYTIYFVNRLTNLYQNVAKFNTIAYKIHFNSQEKAHRIQYVLKENAHGIILKIKNLM